MTEAAYRACHSLGRIRTEDIDAVLDREGLDVPLRRAMMIPGARTFRTETIHWEIEESGLIDNLRKDLPVSVVRAIHKDSPRALFEFWLARTPLPGGHESRRRAYRQDIDDVVNPLLIKLSSVFSTKAWLTGRCRTGKQDSGRRVWNFFGSRALSRQTS